MRAKEFINEKINPDVLDPRFSHKQQIGDYTYTAALEPDRFHKADLFVIRCYDGDKMIGQAKFYTTFGDSLVSALTTVQPAYQKSGIASTMYAYARMLGNTIEPSASQLPPGKRMWKAWKKSGEAKHLMKEAINKETLNPNFTHSIEDNGITYTAKYLKYAGDGKSYFTIKATQDNNRVGEVMFRPKTDGKNNYWLESFMTWVNPEYRKLGVTRMMYAYAKMLGNDIKPSDDQTPRGKAMWQSWKDSGDAQHLVKEEVLDEAATSIVYHYAGVPAASKILTSGVFQLSSITGNKSEEQYAPPGHPYFLSTTRSKVGDYHRYTGSSAVMFVLDGNWLNQRYKTKPVDYWERAWQHSGGSRTSESEDRVFSKEPEIPINGVLAVHVLIKEQSENRSPEVRTILINAKKRGIPAYLYTDEAAWRLQDTRKAVTPAAAAPLLKGQQTKGYTPSRPQTMYLEPWLELIYKNNKADLSPRAEKLRYDLVYYGSRYPNEDSNLGTDMSNARKPNSTDYPMAVKINDYMRKNKIPSTVALKNMLVDKWDKIK